MEDARVKKVKSNTLDPSRGVIFFVFLIVFGAMTILSYNSFLVSETHPFSRMLALTTSDHRLVFTWFGVCVFGLYAFPYALRLLVIAVPMLMLASITGLVDDLIAATVHAFALAALGYLALVAFRAKAGLAECLFLGLPIYILLLAALSVLSLVTETVLTRAEMGLVLVAGGLYLSRNGFQHSDVTEHFRKPSFSVGLLLFSIVLARSTGTVSSDPNWYSYFWLGSLAEPSLWSEGGYVNAVHGYGKITEVANGFLGFREDPSAEILFTSLYLIAAVSVVMRRFAIELRSLRFVILLLLAGAPAVLGLAATGKADILPVSALLIFCTVAINKTINRDYLLILVCILVFLTSKPTYLVWGGLLCLLYLSPLIQGLRERRNLAALALIALSILVLWGITLSNTGLLYVGLGVVVDLQGKLGLTPSNPFTNVDLGTLAVAHDGALDRIRNQLFDPGQPGNHGLSWTGLVLFPSLAIILLRWRHISHIDIARSGLVFLFMLAIVALINAPSPTLDGFYILPAYIFLALIAIGSLPVESGVMAPIWLRVGHIGSAFAAFAVVIGAIQYGDWRTPLKRSDLVGGEAESYEEVFKIGLDYHDMTDVYRYIMDRTMGATCRARFVPVGRQTNLIIRQIPCNVEDSFSFSWQPPLRNAFLRNPNVTAQYLEYADSRFIIVERGQERLEPNLGWLRDYGYAEVPLNNQRWRLYDRGI